MKMRRILGLALAILCGWLSFAAHLRADPFVPNDPYYGKYQWYSKKIGLEDAWNSTQGSSALTIAILDTGVLPTAPDIAPRLLPPLSTTGTPPFDVATINSTTVLRHGTWVASTAAMGINNSIGGAGVGQFSILPITISNLNGNNSTQWIVDAVKLAADSGAKVINISQSTLSYGAVDSAAAYARSKGALVFMAGGNRNAREDRGVFDNIIFVGGSDQNDNRWVQDNTTGSTYGPYIDLAAPSVDILVADPTTPNGYGLIAGTSFASPMAAGLAGLIWSINPQLSPDDVQNILFSTAVDLGPIGVDEFFGHGRINAAAAVHAAWMTVPEPSAIALMGCGFAFVVWAARRRAKKSTARDDNLGGNIFG